MSAVPGISNQQYLERYFNNQKVVKRKIQPNQNLLLGGFHIGLRFHPQGPGGTAPEDLEGHLGNLKPFDTGKV